MFHKFAHFTPQRLFNLQDVRLTKDSTISTSMSNKITMIIAIVKTIRSSHLSVLVFTTPHEEIVFVVIGQSQQRTMTGCWNSATPCITKALFGATHLIIRVVLSLRSVFYTTPS